MFIYIESCSGATIADQDRSHPHVNDHEHDEPKRDDVPSLGDNDMHDYDDVLTYSMRCVDRKSLVTESMHYDVSANTTWILRLAAAEGPHIVHMFLTFGDYIAMEDVKGKQVILCQIHYVFVDVVVVC